MLDQSNKFKHCTVVTTSLYGQVASQTTVMIYVAFTKPEIATPLENEILKLYCRPGTICDVMTNVSETYSMPELLGVTGLHALLPQEDPFTKTEVMLVSALLDGL